jgi:phosphoribosylaminoimidazole-succinocarboxamide synthase
MLPNGAARAHYRGFECPSNENTPLTESLFESNLSSLQLLARGKVRDIYNVDAERLLIVATDRLSVFDVVLPDLIPGKGVILTSI